MNKNFVSAAIAIALLSWFAIEKFMPLPKTQNPAPDIELTAQDKARAVVQKGWELENQGKIDEALAHYNTALTIDPNCAVAYKHRGTAYARQGALEKAIPEFEKAIELDPSHASSFYNLGNLYLSMGDYDHAIANFSKALELNPSYTTALMNRAATYARKKEFAKAAADYEGFLIMVPNHKDAFLALAAIYRVMGETAKAIEVYNKAILVLPNDKNFYFGRARLYYAQKDYQQAIMDLTKVIELDPQNIEAYQARMDLYELTNQKEKAIEDRAQIKTLDPQSYRKLLSQRAVLSYIRRQPQKALEEINEVITMDPNDSKALETRIEILLDLEKFVEALVDADSLLKQNPQKPEHLMLRGKIYSRKKEYALAVSDFDKAIARNDKNPAFYSERAAAYLGQGQYDLSWADIAKAREFGGKPARDLIFELESKSRRMDPQTKLETPGDYYNAYIKYFMKGYLKRAWDIIEDGITKFPDDQELFQVKERLDEIIKENHNGIPPEKITVNGADFVLDMAESIGADLNGQTVILGQGEEKDSIQFHFGTLSLKGPMGWFKETDIELPGRGRLLIQYKKLDTAKIPAIVVSADKIFPGIRSALEYSQKIKQMYSISTSKVNISEPKEENIQGRTASYIEMDGKGMHDIAFRIAWYQFLFEDTIVTVQLTGTDYEFKEAFPEFRKVVESMDVVLNETVRADAEK